MARVAETGGMKIKILITVVSTCFILDSAFAQGALTPPGAPAPTMRTLDQLDAKLEKRTPISAVPFTVSVPGSYYLTTNVTTAVSNAIVITANGVTLDLGGWTIASTATNAANGGTAILLTGGLKNVTIQNGFIQGGVTNNGSGVFSGSGFANGIYYSSGAPINVLASKVSVSGCLFNGINLSVSGSTVVESCTARTIGNIGLSASTVKGCGAADCGNYAIYGDLVSDCRGAAVGNGYGVYATTAQNSDGQCSGNGYGVYAITALNCHGNSDGSGDGIYAYTAQNCYGYNGSNGTALFAVCAQNCYGFNNANGTGLHATSVASGCTGTSITGTGLVATIANSCSGTVITSGTPLSTTHNVNSF